MAPVISVTGAFFVVILLPLLRVERAKSITESCVGIW